MKPHFLLVIALLATLVGCKTTYYKTWQTLGWDKRHLLVDEVEDAKASQEQAKEQFKTTMERFQDLTKFEGGELEAKYKKLNGEYESCVKRADAVTTSIKDVDSVAQDMFKEWSKELSEYDNPELKKSSEQKLNESRAKYDQLIAAMRKSEAKMQPVLKAFHDQVLYLKHNLNASAISSLQSTAAGIDKDVQALIKDMEASIAEANTFISQMKT